MKLDQILYDRMGIDGEFLAGKRAVVTGGAMGIGQQAAMGLACLGARVAIVDRDTEKANRTGQPFWTDDLHCRTGNGRRTAITSFARSLHLARSGSPIGGLAESPGIRFRQSLRSPFARSLPGNPGCSPGE